MTCSVTTINNTQQSTFVGCTKKKTKRQKMVLTEMAMGIMVTGMTVTATSMTMMAMSMTVTVHIPHLVL
eukprot:10263266-Ditylum_brightwellii.AAC.1